MAHPDLEVEQRYFDALYARLDAEIERTESRLSDVRVQSVGGLHQARYEREVFAGHLEDRMATLRAHRRDDLCFGRIDMADGRRLYIGRLGLADDEQEPLLVDWRAPVAAPFYQATPREPMGVKRRRHFLTRARTVKAIEDEVLDADALSGAEAEALRGEAALQYVMGSARTGRMREVAATLQREQDEVIRAPLTPAVFVQGGPGTGKTAVALHRAAYLLYGHRRRLSARDVLVIGPNALFLRYIENVLPSLGESGVTLTAVPHVYRRRAWPREEEPARSVKAGLAMVEVIARAVATRRRPLSRAAVIEIEGERLRVSAADTRGIVAGAAGRPGRHNSQAVYVRDRLARLLWRRGAKRLLAEVMEYEDFRAEIRGRRDFRRLADRVWPVLTPEQLLNDLFGFPALLREAVEGVLDEAEGRALARDWSPDVRSAMWTDADAPLLDEAARQLGPIPAELDPREARRAGRRYDDEEARAEAEYSRELLRGLGGGIVPRHVLEERLLGRSGRERPDGEFDETDDADDGDEAGLWRYVVVDEAQDVSPMAWRMIGRHAPRRAATVVGDVAQGTEAWSPASWDEVRRAMGAGESARVAELTVNYRTPEEVAGYAEAVLAAFAPELRPPRSIRSVPGSLSIVPVEPSDLATHAVGAALDPGRVGDDGTACLVAPPSLVGPVRGELERRVGAVPDPDDPAMLDAPVAVTTPELVKGLEFDLVVVIDPERLVRESGWRALYVSATRATRQLVVVHTGPDPVPIDRPGAPM